MDKKTIIIVVVAVLVILCLCCSVVGGVAAYIIYTSTQPAVEVSEVFMEALKNDDMQQAFTLLAPNTKKDIGDPLKLMKIAEEEDLIPKEWRISGRSADQKKAKIEGSMTTRAGTEKNFLIELHLINERWMITYYGEP